jgi:hypothetical protein
MKFLASLITLVAFLDLSHGLTNLDEATNDNDCLDGTRDCQTALKLDALRLRVAPTPTVLDADQASSILRELEAIISRYFRALNNDGVHSGLFRAMQFDNPSEILFESGNDTNERRSLTTSASGKPTTILDIGGIEVSFKDKSPAEGEVMANLQEYINQLDFSGKDQADGSGMTSPRMQDNSVSNSQIRKNLSIPVDSFTLTWASQGYTLAPIVMSPTTQPPTITTIGPEPSKTKFTYPVLACGLVVVVLAGLFLAKRRRRNKGAELQNDDGFSPTRRRLWSASRHDEFDGLEWMRDSPESKMGAFPTFDSSDRANIKVTVVDYENQPANPKDIGMIDTMNDSDSEVSSLGKSEGRMEVTRPAYLSSRAMDAFPVTTNLTRVNGIAGDDELYHETMEGFDRLDDECWVSDKGSSKPLQGLLGSYSDSLRYSSDSSSQDVDGFFPTPERTTVLGRREQDTSAEEDALYVHRPIEFVPPSRIIGRIRKAPTSSTQDSSNEDLQVLSFDGDDNSSVGDMLRSIV